MGLVHVKRFLKISSEGSDEDLIHLVFHDKVGQPPALRSLDAIPIDEKSRH
jgi:hypothetical protein